MSWANPVWPDVYLQLRKTIWLISDESLRVEDPESFKRIGKLGSFDSGWHLVATPAHLGVNSVKIIRAPNKNVGKISGCPLVNLSFAEVVNSCHTSSFLFR